MEDQRQIVAIGGLTPSSAPSIFAYLVRQSKARVPRVGFLPTASADSDAAVAKFHASFARLACEPSHLSLFGRVSSPARFVESQDVVLVGGGNTKSMLGLWREWGVDTLLREAWEAGTVLAGFSAGAICWFAQGLSDSWVDHLVPVAGLGFLPGSCCPHYDGEAERRPTYHRSVQDGSIGPGIAIDDDCAVHFIGTEAKLTIKTRAGAGAYQIGLDANEVIEKPLTVPVETLSAV